MLLLFLSDWGCARVDRGRSAAAIVIYGACRRRRFDAAAANTHNTKQTKVMARVMGAEAALVRIQFVSGTHAIAAALYAVLRPGDELLAVAGK